MAVTIRATGEADIRLDDDLNLMVTRDLDAENRLRR
jgi:hypothetical protein